MILLGISDCKIIVLICVCFIYAFDPLHFSRDAPFPAFSFTQEISWLFSCQRKFPGLDSRSLWPFGIPDLMKKQPSIASRTALQSFLLHGCKIAGKLRLAGWPCRQIESSWQMTMQADLFYFFFFVFVNISR